MAFKIIDFRSAIIFELNSLSRLSTSISDESRLRSELETKVSQINSEGKLHIISDKMNVEEQVRRIVDLKASQASILIESVTFSLADRSASFGTMNAAIRASGRSSNIEAFIGLIERNPGQVNILDTEIASVIQSQTNPNHIFSLKATIYLPFWRRSNSQ
jgi:hypothetical protein